MHPNVARRERVFSKSMQKIRHYLKADKIDSNKRIMHEGENMPKAAIFVHYCGDTWNQVMRELAEWNALQGAVAAYSLLFF